MASLRKRSNRVEASDNGPPVSTPPEVTAAELPEPVADPKPPEPIESKSAADAAASSAIEDRLAEMERAESLARQGQQPPQQHVAEPQQEQQPEMPPRVQEWLSRHPQYMDPNDQIAQVEISLATMKCTRDGLTWNDDDFLPSIERHLGLRQAQGNGHAAPTVQQATRAPAPVSAPPREPTRA